MFLAWLSAVAASANEPIAPYSAQQVVERVQILADGTRITQTPQKMNEYRDSERRTRTEELSVSDTEAPRVTSINIVDPVASFRYSLDPEAHVARQKSLPKLAAKATTSVAPKQGEQPQVSSESLGTDTVDGLLIRGTRTTTVYPTGWFGNDRPITVVRENWISLELQIVVLSKVSDPRTGEFTRRLTNISRNAPDPSVFQIPAGYEVIDGGASEVPVTRGP
jgi:hypothetical protein